MGLGGLSWEQSLRSGYCTGGNAWAGQSIGELLVCEGMVRKLKIALYPGSFDPLHHGHLAIIAAAASVFDSVVVSVGFNPEKSGFFSPDERVQMITEATNSLENVTTSSFSGLVTAEAARCDASCLIKGIRSATDLDVEMLQAKMNYETGNGLPTLFLPGIGTNALLSSRYIREVSSAGGPIRSVVPANVAECLEKRAVK